MSDQLSHLRLPRSIWIGAIALLALRAFVILVWGESVSPDLADHPVYHKNALKLLSGWEMWVTPGSEFGYRAPLFFAYIAGALGLTGSESYHVSQLATALLSTIDCVLVFVIARALGGERAGQIAFWIRGLLPSFLFSDTYVLSEHLFAIFMLGALAIVAIAQARPTVRQSVVLGALLGLCMLTREAGLVFMAVFIAYLVLASGSLRERAVRPVACLVALTVVLLPWLIRNEAVWDKPLPLSYTAGVGLYNGNNPDFTGEGFMPAKPAGVNLKFGTPEYERWHREKALEYIMGDPAGFFARMPVKVAWFMWPRFQRYDLGVVYPSLGAAIQPLSVLIGLSSALVLVLGVVCFLARPIDAWWWVSLGIIGGIGAAILVTGGDPRYRDPIDYVFVISIGTILAGGGNPLKRTLQALLAQPWRAVLVGVIYAVIGASWLWVALFKSAHP